MDGRKHVQQNELTANISRRALFFQASVAGISAATIAGLAEVAIPQTSAKAAPMARGGIVFPAAMGWANVRDHGAKGDGVTDDTQAIRATMQAARQIGGRVYFPNGVYLVSDRIEWVNNDHNWRPEGDFWSFMSFQGQSQHGTIIKLADNAPGYQDAAQPRSVLYTASSLDGTSGPYDGDKDYPALGEGNTAFSNDIQDLTVDTGRGNPGAVGIDYIGSNVAVVRNVTIRSGDGAGVTGLKITRKWTGPQLITRVRIIGFDYGIQTAEESYHTTFEHVVLEKQRVVALHNDNHLLSIRGLYSVNNVPVIQNTLGGQISLVDCLFVGQPVNAPAIENSEGCGLWARKVFAPNYQAVINNRGTIIPGKHVTEFVADPVLSLFPSRSTSLNLPVRETPTVPVAPPEDWANVEDYGAVRDTSIDSTEGFQKALDSGKSSIYVPPGHYQVNGTLVLRGNVQRIHGMYTSFVGDVTLRVEPGRHNVVVIEQFFANTPRIIHASPKTLVLRDVIIKSYLNEVGSGPLFLENVVGGDWTFDHQEVWARQFDIEGEHPRSLVENRGGKLWILGIKSEGTATLIETNNGGQTEVLGGLLYPVGAVPEDRPAFRCTEAQHSLIYSVNGGGGGFWWAGKYTLHVEETRDGETRQLLDSAVPQYRDSCAIIPLYSGAPLA